MATPYSNTQGGLLSRLNPGALWGFPSEWPTTPGSPGSFGCSPVWSGKGLWRFPWSLPAYDSIYGNIPSSVSSTVSTTPGGAVSSRPASSLRFPLSTLTLVSSQALLPWSWTLSSNGSLDLCWVLQAGGSNMEIAGRGPCILFCINTGALFTLLLQHELKNFPSQITTNRPFPNPHPHPLPPAPDIISVCHHPC